MTTPAKDRCEEALAVAEAIEQRGIAADVSFTRACLDAYGKEFASAATGFASAEDTFTQLGYAGRAIEAKAGELRARRQLDTDRSSTDAPARRDPIVSRRTRARWNARTLLGRADLR